MFKRKILLALILAFAPVTMANAAGDAEHPLTLDWSFNGPFGYYDKAAMQRGYKIYREVCSACHSMKRIAFRNLEDLGYTEDEIKAVAGQYVVEDGPNAEGDMFERAALPSDRFPAPFANDNAAKFANGGALPPDLSLITRARANGSNYVYSLLTGFEAAPEGEDLADGQYWNKYYAGHKLSMAPPLMDGIVEYEDGTPETLEQYATDVTHFLTWAADPHMEERKETGFRVLLFLLVFAIVMYAVKKKTWADLH